MIITAVERLQRDTVTSEATQRAINVFLYNWQRTHRTLQIVNVWTEGAATGDVGTLFFSLFIAYRDPEEDV